MENYEDIYYLDCPHFTVGHVDQWGEHGYLLYGGQVYFYEVDRKDQMSTTRSPMAIGEFLASAENFRITVPEDFLNKLAEVEREVAEINHGNISEGAGEHY